jgi:hypothetical protein
VYLEVESFRFVAVTFSSVVDCFFWQWSDKNVVWMTGVWYSTGAKIILFSTQFRLDLVSIQPHTKQGPAFISLGLEQSGSIADHSDSTLSQKLRMCSTPPVFCFVLNWEQGELNFIFSFFLSKNILIKLEKYFMLVNLTTKTTAWKQYFILRKITRLPCHEFMLPH